MKVVKDVYDELNTKYKLKEIYTEDFTPEQVFYQIEALCDKVLREYESVIQKKYEQHKQKALKSEQKTCDNTSSIKHVSNTGSMNANEGKESVEEYNDSKSFNGSIENSTCSESNAENDTENDLEIKRGVVGNIVKKGNILTARNGNVSLEDHDSENATTYNDDNSENTDVEDSTDLLEGSSDDSFEQKREMLKELNSESEESCSTISGDDDCDYEDIKDMPASEVFKYLDKRLN